jgi:hypothetical protein
MSRPTFRGRLKAVAADFCQLINSPSTRKDFFSTNLPMKTTPFVFLANLAIAGMAHSEDKTAFASSVPATIPTTARILGTIPDGTPPPPSEPMPEYKVAPNDILQTTTLREGGRNVTLQQIKPIALPPPPQAVESAAVPSQEFLQRLSEFRAAHPRSSFLNLGATIYHSKYHPTRTLLQLWPEGGGQTIKIWSSADFTLIAGGIRSFIDTSGRTRHLMIMPSVIDIDRMTTLFASRGKSYTAPQIPTLPEGKATFQIIGDSPSPSDLTAIQSLHDLYNNQHAELLAAHQGREQASFQREAELKANPPQPQDITLRYWRTERRAPKGGDQ